MADTRTTKGSERPPRSTPAAVKREAKPRVDTSSRVVVGFPFSNIKVDDTLGAAAVADIVAQVCRLLAEPAPPDAFHDLARAAEELAEHLRR